MCEVQKRLEDLAGGQQWTEKPASHGAENRRRLTLKTGVDWRWKPASNGAENRHQMTLKTGVRVALIRHYNDKTATLRRRRGVKKGADSITIDFTFRLTTEALLKRRRLITFRKKNRQVRRRVRNDFQGTEKLRLVFRNSGKMMSSLRGLLKMIQLIR